MVFAPKPPTLQYIFDSDLTPIAWIGVALSIVSGYVFVYSKTKVAPVASAMPRPIVSSPSLEMLLPSSEDPVEEGASEDTSTESEKRNKIPPAKLALIEA